MARVVVLPSGAKLEITVSPFSISKALYKDIAAEMKSLKLDPNSELDFTKKNVDMTFYKDILCTVLSSDKIEKSLTECMRRATYNGIKITDEIWEKEEARGDYLVACFEVAVDNINPFLKGLSQKFEALLGQFRENQASRPKTMIS